MICTKSLLNALSFICRGKGIQKTFRTIHTLPFSNFFTLESKNKVEL